MNDDLTFLLDWYSKQCDGHWEHTNGIKIGTLDNPGWYVRIHLGATQLENQNVQPVNIEQSEHDWIYCGIKDKMFKGYGGPLNLPELLRIFRKWAEGSENENKSTVDENLVYLFNWFERHCDGDWEHCYGVRIETINNPGWSVKITLQETELLGKRFQNVDIKRSEEDWCYCRVNNGFFESGCGIFNLPEVLKTFRNWVESDQEVIVWERIARFDNSGKAKSFNKFSEQYVIEPHVHDPNIAGGVRPAEAWEIPS